MPAISGGTNALNASDVNASQGGSSLSQNNANTSGSGASVSGSGSGSGNGMQNQTNTAGFSPLIILALIGAGAAFFLRKKHSYFKVISN
jgi:hypothetical protein